ncbi:ATP-binding cassette domain-containing protein [Micromonospora sp. NPDC047644]|uniref:ATP-binding cassette domain-containing protein n=1 Tax=Micromonospora sp. NPDC047644 TaxID=3157203 RepID=UPI00345255DD
MGTLRVSLHGREVELAEEEVHYLVREGERLAVSRTPIDGGSTRQLGFFVPVLGRWFFHADNVPAARVLRIDGAPVINARQELPTDRPTALGLASETPTGPVNPRRLVDEKTLPPPSPHDTAAGEPPSRGLVRYVIGRAGTNADIPIDDPLVRARHATVRVDAKGRWWISGELYVDGVQQMSATLADGEVFVIGQTAVTVSPDLLPGGQRPELRQAGVRKVGPATLRRPTTETGLAVRLEHLTAIGDRGKILLDDVSLDITPGQVVAVVGPSGAGKSSLIRVLMGEVTESAGIVHLGPGTGGRTDPQLRRRQVRYVPQGDEDLFATLSARETLTYAARLRAAPDTTAREVQGRVDDVLRRLGLDQPAALAERRIDKLSGGQRRRVSIGMELVGDPQLLLLDEPTSGLDPGKDRAIMADLRAVSATYHCTVVIVTHATEHLGMVDKVLVVAKGGRIRDAGPPETVLETLGHDSWADLMTELDREPAASESRGHPPTTAAFTRNPSPARWALAGFGTLLHRQFTLTRRRGRASLAVLFAVPLICTVIAVVASPDGLRPGPETGAVLAILVTLAALTGAALTYPDIVADERTLHRDFRVGVEALPIVLSKAVVYAGVCVMLAGVVTVAFATARDLPPMEYGVPPLVMLYGVVLLTMLASMGIGLLISAGAPTLERAVTWSTLLAVTQVALSGTLFRLDRWYGLPADVLPARLGLAAIASYMDLNRHRRPALYEDWLWNPGAARFWVLNALAVVLFLLAVVGSVRRLHRRWTR